MSSIGLVKKRALSVAASATLGAVGALGLFVTVPAEASATAGIAPAHKATYTWTLTSGCSVAGVLSWHGLPAVFAVVNWDYVDGHFAGSGKGDNPHHPGTPVKSPQHIPGSLGNASSSSHTFYEVLYLLNRHGAVLAKATSNAVTAACSGPPPPYPPPPTSP